MKPLTEILATMEYGPSPESTAEAQAWLDHHQRRFGLFIDNQWSTPGKLFASRNPADDTALAELTQASGDDIDRAVAAARRAQPGWAALSGHARARALYALARLIQKHARLFAVLETLDNGKPIRETRDIDIPLAARHFYHHAGWAQLLASEFADYRAVGVVGQIVPWNFPLLMLAWKIAPALACGNTVVFKPAEFTSLSALLFAELCQQAQLPPGVVNIITGDGAVGEAMVTHPGIDKLAFTGSTEVGRLIRRATAGSGKKLSLELRQIAVHRVRGCRPRCRRRRAGRQHLVQPGPGLLRRFAAAGAGVGGAALSRQSSRAHGPLDRRLAAGQVHRHRRAG